MRYVPLRSATKPLPGTLLDPHYPLSGGIVNVYLFNEGSGQSVWESARGRTQTLQTPNPPVWTSTPEGFAVANTASNGHGISVFEPPISSSFTIACRLFQTASPASDYARAIYSDGNFGFYLYTRQLSYYHAGFNNTGLFMPAGFATIAITVSTEMTMVGYVDGVASAAVTIPGTNLPTGATQIMADGVGGQTFDGIMEWLYIWNRPLSFDEIGLLTADPYGLFLPTRIRRSDRVPGASFRPLGPLIARRPDEPAFYE